MPIELLEAIRRNRGEILREIAGRISTSFRIFERDLPTNAQSPQDVFGVDLKRFVVTDEVVARAARLAQLVVRPPVTVDVPPLGRRIENVAYKLVERDRSGPLRTTIATLDLAGDPPKTVLRPAQCAEITVTRPKAGVWA